MSVAQEFYYDTENTWCKKLTQLWLQKGIITAHKHLATLQDLILCDQWTISWFKKWTTTMKSTKRVVKDSITHDIFTQHWKQRSTQGKLLSTVLKKWNYVKFFLLDLVSISDWKEYRQMRSEVRVGIAIQELHSPRRLTILSICSPGQFLQVFTQTCPYFLQVKSINKFLSSYVKQNAQQNLTGGKNLKCISQ